MAFTVKELRETICGWPKIRIYKNGFNEDNLIFKTTSMKKIPKGLLDREVAAIDLGFKNTIDIGLAEEKHTGLKSFDDLHNGDKVRCLNDDEIYDVYFWHWLGYEGKETVDICLCHNNNIWPASEFDPKDFEKVDEK